MKTNDFDYKLENKYIATKPVSPRDSSKLLVLDRKSGNISHKTFHDITQIFSANDILVFNQTKVNPSKLIGRKNTGGKTEVLLLEEKSGIWMTLTKNIGKASKIDFSNKVSAKIVKKEEKFTYLKFNLSRVKFDQFLAKNGLMPIPPYILKNRLSESDSKTLIDEERTYNTVYAKNKGSVAAPTAGLHFTEELINTLSRKNIGIAKLTLKVGLGTFETVKTESLIDHKMHSETYQISPDVAQYLNEQKRSGRRIIAVGTTTTRVLETVSNEKGFIDMTNLNGSTSLFVLPPYRFKFVDGLITNFHLPKSTLLSLVSAFTSYPQTGEKFKDFQQSTLAKAYFEAMRRKYRFYSYGDAMLIS